MSHANAGTAKGTDEMSSLGSASASPQAPSIFQALKSMIPGFSSPPAPPPPPPQNTIVDLTNAVGGMSNVVGAGQELSSSLEQYAAAYEKEASRAFQKSSPTKLTAKKKPKRQRRQRRATAAASPPIDTKKTTPKDVDAIDVDAAASTQEESAETKKPCYREVLGPLRMDFVDSFATAHNVQSFSLSYGKKKAASRSAAKAKTTTNLQKLYKELVEYQINLPVDAEGAIYCRAVESDLTTIRVLLTGPLQTPYAAGCFLFDVELEDYPHKPPKVKFLTTGGGMVRFNPNLYADGKVCLSLLGTWSGPSWMPGKSTLLQVLVSIQGLIMVDEPYFNEPGYERDRGTPRGTKASTEYNRKLYAHTLRYAVLEMMQHGATRYPEFYPVMQRHFAYHRDFLLQKMQQWCKESPNTVGPLVPQVHAALASLPPLTRKRAKKANSKPETISLLDDDGDEKVAPSSCMGQEGKGTTLKKAPETIVLD